MVNSKYTKARQKFLDAGINWTGDTIKAVIVDNADYTVNLTTHEFLSDIPSVARVATATLTGKTSTAGVADAIDTQFTAPTGDVSESVVIYKDTGSAATSPLIVYIDAAVGVPVTPNGDDILILWPATGIFKI